MICALLSGGVINSIRNQMDYEKVGGAMFLGLSKVVVKGHGNSKAKSFEASIMQAANAVRGNLTDKIKAMIDSVDMNAVQEKVMQISAESAQ